MQWLNGVRCLSSALSKAKATSQGMAPNNRPKAGHTIWLKSLPTPVLNSPPRTQEEGTIEEEENDDGVCCQLCGHPPGDISECGTCHLNMCTSCMPLHSCTLQD